MCHKIIYDKNVEFIQYNSYYIGIKRFKIKEKTNWIGGSFSWKIQKLTQSKIGLNIYSELTNQNVTLVPLNTTIKILTGAHIRPFSINKINEIYWDYPKLFPHAFNLLVLFKDSNVRFFDGSDVSVSCFTIPNYITLKNILKIYMPKNKFTIFGRKLQSYEEAFQFVKSSLYKYKRRNNK